MSVDDVVSRVGLWWTAADEDVLRTAAEAWDRAAAVLDRAGATGLEGATRAGSTWSGASAEAVARTWRDHAGALRGDAAGCRALAGALRSYARGPQLRRFRVGVHESPGARFQPHEFDQADLLAGGGTSVHARPVIDGEGVTNPDAMVRTGREDPGTYTEFKRPTAMTTGAVKNEIMKAGKQLDGYRGGELVLDGRTVGLTDEVARHALARAMGQSASHGSRLPTTIRLVLGDGTSIYYP